MISTYYTRFVLLCLPIHLFHLTTCTDPEQMIDKVTCTSRPSRAWPSSDACDGALLRLENTIASSLPAVFREDDCIISLYPPNKYLPDSVNEYRDWDEVFSTDWQKLSGSVQKVFRECFTPTGQRTASLHSHAYYIGGILTPATIPDWDDGMGLVSVIVMVRGLETQRLGIRIALS
jgi:hypothetical protein